MTYMTKEYIPSARQMFVLNRGSYISSLSITKKPLTIGSALRLLNQLEIRQLENILGLKG